MKKSDIIDLALKIFGIYVVIIAILSLKDIHYLRFNAAFDPDTINYTGIGVFLGAGLVTLLIGYLLIFKSSKLARKICKNDFDINLSFDLNYNKILEISLIILGLSILILKFSNFIGSISELVSQFTSIHPQGNSTIAFSVAVVLQYILGYVLVTNSKAITDWIIRINQKNFGEVEN